MSKSSSCTSSSSSIIGAWFSLNGMLRRHKRTQSLPEGSQEQSLVTDALASTTDKRHRATKVHADQQLEVMAPATANRQNLEATAAMKLDRYCSLLGLARQETVVKACPCFLVSDLLIQGTLVVTDRHVCFHSSLFGMKRNMKLSFNDIRCISREKVYALFPTGIAVRMVSGDKVTFSSATSRDRLLQLLREQLKKSSAAAAAASETAGLRQADGIVEVVEEDEEVEIESSLQDSLGGNLSPDTGSAGDLPLQPAEAAAAAVTIAAAAAATAVTTAAAATAAAPGFPCCLRSRRRQVDPPPREDLQSSREDLQLCREDLHPDGSVVDGLNGAIGSAATAGPDSDEGEPTVFSDPDCLHHQTAADSATPEGSTNWMLSAILHFLLSRSGLLAVMAVTLALCTLAALHFVYRLGNMQQQLAVIAASWSTESCDEASQRGQTGPTGSFDQLHVELSSLMDTLSGLQSRLSELRLLLMQDAGFDT